MWDRGRGPGTGYRMCFGPALGLAKRTLYEGGIGMDGNPTCPLNCSDEVPVPIVIFVEKVNRGILSSYL